MSIVANKTYCGCGCVLQEEMITVTWSDEYGKVYTITNVPILQCHNDSCLESYHPGDVEISLAILADEMEQGFLSNTIMFRMRM